MRLSRVNSYSGFPQHFGKRPAGKGFTIDQYAVAIENDQRNILELVRQAHAVHRDHQIAPKLSSREKPRSGFVI